MPPARIDAVPGRCRLCSTLAPSQPRRSSKHTIHCCANRPVLRGRSPRRIPCRAGFAPRHLAAILGPHTPAAGLSPGAAKASPQIAPRRSTSSTASARFSGSRNEHWPALRQSHEHRSVLRDLRQSRERSHRENSLASSSAGRHQRRESATPSSRARRQEKPAEDGGHPKALAFAPQRGESSSFTRQTRRSASRGVHLAEKGVARRCQQ